VLAGHVRVGGLGREKNWLAGHVRVGGLGREKNWLARHARHNMLDYDELCRARQT